MSLILKDLSSAALVAAIEKNLQATWYLVGGTRHANIEIRADLMRLQSTVPSPLCNGVFRACFDPETADRQIEETVLPFKCRNLPMIWWTMPSSQPRDLGSRLEDHGLIHAGNAPGMAIDLATIPDRYQAPDGVHIRSVATVRTLRHWATALETGFGMSEPAATFFFNVFAALGPEYRLPVRHYVGFLNQEPVACSSMFLLGGVAGIYNVATVPEVRGRGIGTAMVSAHLLRARAEGYRVAILHSSESGLGVYRRLGFRQYCEIGQYVLESKPMAEPTRFSPSRTSRPFSSPISAPSSCKRHSPPMMASA